MANMNVYTKYYSAKPMLSKGAIFNMCLSDRSDGKTFDIKYRILENYKNSGGYLKGQQGMLVRRWATEITSAMTSSFFNEVLRVKEDMAKAYAGYEFMGTSGSIKIRPVAEEGKKNTNQWDTIVYVVPLTKSGKLKSNWDVARIHEIDFDEYAPLDGRYIKDEMTYLLELYKSVDRDRYTTQLCCFGNKIDPFNPFFSFFKLELSIEQSKIRTYRDGTLCVQIYSCAEHREHVAASDFSKLVDGTSYEGYNAGGILNASNFPIMKVDKTQDRYLFSFKTKDGEGSVWKKNNVDWLVISNDFRKDGICVMDANYKVPNKDTLIATTNNNYTDILRQFYQVQRLALTQQALHPAAIAMLSRAAWH